MTHALSLSLFSGGEGVRERGKRFTLRRHLGAGRGPPRTHFPQIPAFAGRAAAGCLPTKTYGIEEEQEQERSVRNIFLFSLLICLEFLSFSAKAETPLPNPYRNAEEIPDVLTQGMSYLPPVKKADYIKKQLYVISREGRNKDALDMTDYNLKVEGYISNEQSKNFQALAKYDLNKDQSVTQEEVMESVKSQPCGWWAKKQCAEKEIWNRQKKAMGQLTAQDKNKDGKVTRNELISRSAAKVIRARNQYKSIRRAVALNPDGDEKLTVKELETLAGFAFDFFDADKDGALSKEESKKAEKISREFVEEEFRKELERLSCQSIKNAKERQNCKLQRGLKDDALIAFLGDKRVLLTFGKPIADKDFSSLTKPWSKTFTAKDLCWIYVEMDPSETKNKLWISGLEEMRFEDLPEKPLLLAAYNPDQVQSRSFLIGKDGLVKAAWEETPELKEVFDKVENLVRLE